MVIFLTSQGKDTDPRPILQAPILQMGYTGHPVFPKWKGWRALIAVHGGFLYILLLLLFVMQAL